MDVAADQVDPCAFLLLTCINVKRDLLGHLGDAELRKDIDNNLDAFIVLFVGALIAVGDLTDAVFQLFLTSLTNTFTS